MADRPRLGFLASLGFAEWKSEQVVETLARLGYGAVGWTLAHFNPRTKRTRELAHVVEVTQERGMSVGELVIQQDYVSLDEATRRDRISLTRECIEAAGQHGIEVANVFSGPAPWDPKAPRIPDDISEAEAWAQVAEAFGAILPTAEAAGVYLAFEGVFGMLCHDFYTTRHLFELFPSPFLAITMDPSHGMLYGNDPAWAVGQWGQKIRHVHLKDVVGVVGRHGRDFIFPLLGEGRSTGRHSSPPSSGAGIAARSPWSSSPSVCTKRSWGGIRRGPRQYRWNT